MHFAVCPLTLAAFSTIRPSLAAPILFSQKAITHHATSAEEILVILEKSLIIPDVLSPFNPSIALSLTYPHHPLVPGRLLPVSVTFHRPTIQLTPFASPSQIPIPTLSANKTYTVILTDPDATFRSKPVKSQMCHWIISSLGLTSINNTEGIPDSSAYTLEPSQQEGEADGADPWAQSEEIMRYMQPAPPKGTGKHRYVFVVLEGAGGQELKIPGERAHWGYGELGKGVKEWTTENGLAVVGATFFYAQEEESQ